jgi:hypothetical protein
LSDAELAREMGDGWTIAATLAHLAFWDQRALVLVKRWQKRGIDASPIDIDGVNEAMLPLLRALPPRAAANLALSAAEAIDRALEATDAELIAAIQAMGKYRLRRWEHRREHIEQIEKVVGSGQGLG